MKKLSRRPLKVVACLFAPIALYLLGTVPAAAKLRTYFIAAEEVHWDYAPSYPDNSMSGQNFTDEQKVFVAGNGETRIGHIYKKARFIEYGDESFSSPVAREPYWEHLGILGPAIRAEVGDTLQLVFKNNTGRVLSLHPHGVLYAKDSEGTPYDDGTSDDAKGDDRVLPGGTYTYIWHVPKTAGPGPNDPDTIVWLYHSHVDEVAETNAGLIGPLLISKRGRLGDNGRPKGIDREFIVLFNVFDENASLYLEDNIREFAPSGNPDEEDFQESNLMHAMNGYLYGNLPGLTMKKGDKVRWYQIALGTEVDLHTPHWHGNTLLWNGNRVDVTELLPASMKVLEMRPNNPGTWMYHCHVNDHLTAGMMSAYTVEP